MHHRSTSRWVKETEASEFSRLYGNSVACVTLTQPIIWLSLISQTSSSDQESMFLGTKKLQMKCHDVNMAV